MLLCAMPPFLLPLMLPLIADAAATPRFAAFATPLLAAMLPMMLMFR